MVRMVSAAELLKFYGPHHKDYADCQGNALQRLYPLCYILNRCYVMLMKYYFTKCWRLHMVWITCFLNKSVSLWNLVLPDTAVK